MRAPGPLRGPVFGSYPPEEVGWLLTDLSDARLEAPTEEREEAIQNGGAHYAESLPIEYQPDPTYIQLYRSTLEATAPRMASAVGTLTELVLRERGQNTVLASLARAGTPAAILMRRWAARVHGLELPHYALSIVRGRGIDTLALRYLAEHHNPADVVFVDGWTGKGAIARELSAALIEHAGATGQHFDPTPAVLADPAHATTLYGTRTDWLIPSACLNSTVSGLVSRTVLNPSLIGEGQFHGAKFYTELAHADMSLSFLDTISAAFVDALDGVLAGRDMHAAADRTADGSGWALAAQIASRFGIHDPNLVKPGIGETTRVLLRRVPWRVLVRTDAADSELAHIRLLAERRNVEVLAVDDLPYACVGLIHPRFTRAATGSGGTAGSIKTASS